MTELNREAMRRLVLQEMYQALKKSRSGGVRRLGLGQWERRLPAGAETAQGRHLFLETLEMLEREGIISVRWARFRKGEIVERVYLESEELLLSACGVITAGPQHDVLDVLSCVDTGPKNAAALAGLLVREAEAGIAPGADTVAAMLQFAALDDETLARSQTRALSVNLYSDSKKLEQLLPLYLRYLEKAGLAFAHPHLLRHYPGCTFRGWLMLEFAGGRVWQLEGETVTLDARSVRSLRSVQAAPGFPQAMLAIENKETFAVLRRDDLYAGYVFTHGFANHAVGEFCALCDGCGFALAHFGDLDPSGIAIYAKMKEYVPALSPWLMNEDLYRRYRAYGFILEGARRRTMPAVIPDELAALAACICSEGLGIEQEIIDYRAE